MLSSILPKRKSSSASGCKTNPTYVTSTLLENIHDPLNADLIWGSQPTTTHATNGLRAFLENHLYSHNRIAFTNVIVELPMGEVVKDERTARGENTKRLTVRLQELHKQDLSSNLPTTQPEVRYQVLKGADLEDGQIRVRIGCAIHVPSPNEREAWSVEVSHNRGQIWGDPIKIHEKHHCVLLGDSPENASFSIADWPFDSHIAIVFINKPEAETLDISAEPLNSLHITPDPDMPGCYKVEAPATNQTDDDTNTQPAKQLYLKCQRLIPAQRQPAELAAAEKPKALSTISVATKSTAPADATNTATTAPQAQATQTPLQQAAPTHMPKNANVPDQTIVYQPEQPTAVVDKTIVWLPPHINNAPMIQLAGIAIQRPSIFQTAGIEAFSFGYDSIGRIVAPNHADAVLRFHINNQDVFKLHTKEGGRVFQLGDKCRLPDATLIEFKPLHDDVSDVYLGYIPMARGAIVSLPTDDANRVFYAGRDSNLTTFAPLQVFSGTEFIKSSTSRKINGDALGISSKHCRLHPIQHEGLEVTAEGQMPVYLLDENMQPISTLYQGDAPDVLKVVSIC